jgi:hypothetical protein
MKRCDLPPDDELRRMIAERYAGALGAVSGVVKFPLPQTKPHSTNFDEAVGTVDELRLEGLSQRRAIRAAYERHSLIHMDAESFVRMYKRYKQERIPEHFYEAVLSGNIDDAIASLKLCGDGARSLLFASICEKISHLF